MKLQSYIVLGVFALLFSACRQEIEEQPMTVERCADAPITLTSSACFSINGKGYVFGGRDEGVKSFTNYLFCYDPQTDSWTELDTPPLKQRVRARAIVVDDAVYMGLGFEGHIQIDTAYLTDWWRWTPSTNQWDSLAPYPNKRTVGPVIETDGKDIYTVFGGSRNFERWVYRYDIAQDEWIKMEDGIDRMASYPPRAHSAAGACCQGRWFCGAGYTRDMSSDFWVEMEMVGDSVVWHRRSALSGKRHNATAVSDQRYIYLAGGQYFGGTLTTGCFYDDILRYDPQTDCWVRIGHLPDGERENMISWVIDNTLYVGLGNDKRNQPCAQLYRIRL